MHGFAAPLGGMFAAPARRRLRGAAAGRAARERARPRRPRARQRGAAARCRELAALLTGRPDATADDGIAWVATLCARAGDPGPRALRHDRRRIPELVAKARVASSMKGNPLPLTDDELTEIARASL